MMLSPNSSYEESGDFPRVIQFKNEISTEEFTLWFQNNKSNLDEILSSTGAILFKGVALQSEDSFKEVIDSIGDNFLNYLDGTTPREQLSSNVYTSTEYPPEQPINLHNELSYSASWPSKIFFCCIKKSDTGGATSIANSRKILENLDSSLVEMVKSKGIRYIRNLVDNTQTKFGQSWQKAFETDDRSFVETYCKDNNIDFEWKSKGGIKLINSSKGIINHPLTGESVWFNQMDQFHASHLGKDVYETLMMMYGEEDDLPMNVTFGDGSKVTEEMVKEIVHTSNALAINNAWEEGELLMLDNVLTSHGRMPYSGNRKILVSMC